RPPCSGSTTPSGSDNPSRRRERRAGSAPSLTPPARTEFLNPDPFKIDRPPADRVMNRHTLSVPTRPYPGGGVSAARQPGRRPSSPSGGRQMAVKAIPDGYHTATIYLI